MAERDVPIVPPAGGTRSCASVTVAQAGERQPKKMSRRLEELLKSNPKTVEVTIAPMSPEALPALEALVRGQGGTVISRAHGRTRLLRARVSPAAVAKLMARDDVRRLEPFVRPRLLNNVAAGIMGVQEVWNAHGLTGRGQLITTADSGLDTGDPSTVMDDFRGRVRAIVPLDGCWAKDAFGHGTHTAGSLAGNGALSSGQFRGVACESDLWVWSVALKDGSIDPLDYGALFETGDSTQPAYIHSASLGAVTHAYTAESVEIDAWLWEHPEVLVVFAAGNGWTSGNYFTSAVDAITSEGAAKNVLAVGATESYRTNTIYRAYADNPSQIFLMSSRGPMYDGRIKPDVCAPGTMILSTRTTQIAYTNTVGWLSYAANSNYTYNSGTSMATPLVAGSAALVRQWLVERRGYAFRPPTAALMKAILTGGARDMSTDAGTNCGGAAPNGAQGWGRIDLEETLYPSNRSVRLVDRIPFAQGQTCAYRVATTNVAPLNVQLVWTDYPGPESDDETPVLVNDLDLSVSNETTGVVWWGNGVTGGDRTNNVEGVRIALAPAATYTIRVTGHAVSHDHAEGGAAALYLRGAFRDGLVLTIR
ncbi:MAG: S8 family serine peptidase [Kiritimatiellae bacterium]|nr:S8 family serine peptidase [Kiritimatiellia bacterium]